MIGDVELAWHRTPQTHLIWKTPSRSSSPINSSPTVSKGNAKLEWDDKYFRGRKEKEIVPG